ncbi:MAG: DUF4168 domain-containing protein [Cytophagaceae bacterium]
MINLKEKKNIIFLFMVFMLPMAAIAQVPEKKKEVNYTEQELKKFVEVYRKATKIQEKNQDKMVEAIEAEKLDIDRFNTILTAQQQQKTDELEASEEELKAFNNAVQKVVKIQTKMQEEISDYIEENLGIKKYDQIVLAYQQDEKVRATIDGIMNQ